MFESQLRCLIEDVLQWPADRVVIRELKAGKHNRRFKLELGAEALSVRWNGQPTHGGIQRASEIHAHRYAAEQGIAPRLQYADERWLVHRFVDGRSPSPDDLQNQRTLQKLVDAVRVLRSGPQLPDRVDPVSLVREFAAAAASCHDLLPPAFTRALHQFDQFAHRVETPSKFVMSHGDLWLDNIVWDGCRMWLLDWECAGMSHPYRDLAKVCIAGEIAASRRPEILQRFCGTDLAEDAQALGELIQTELLLHTAWCLAYGDAATGNVHHDAGSWLDRFFQEGTSSAD